MYKNGEMFKDSKDSKDAEIKIDGSQIDVKSFLIKLNTHKVNIRVNDKIKECEEVKIPKYDSKYAETPIAAYKYDNKTIVCYQNNYSSDPRFCGPDFARIYDDIDDIDDIDDEANYDVLYFIKSEFDIKKILIDKIDNVYVDSDEEYKIIAETVKSMTGLTIDEDTYDDLYDDNFETIKTITENYKKQCYFNMINVIFEYLMTDCEFALVDDIEYDDDQLYDAAPSIDQYMVYNIR